MPRVVRLVLPTLLVAVMISGPGALPPAAPAEAVAQSVDPADPPWEPDDEYLDADHRALVVLQAAPELGSYFLQGTTLNVGLTEPTAANLAEAIAAIRRHEPSLVWTRVQSFTTRYSYEQLVDWHDRLWEVFQLEGVVMTDLEFENNRLAVGVDDVAARTPAIRALLDAQGIPQDAVHILPHAPAVYMLRSQRRPLAGGLEIEFDRPNFGRTDCSIGFVGNLFTGERGFVTAAHCSTQENAVDYTPYFQPDVSFFASPVGEEVWDPNRLHTCPGTNLTCKWADANFVKKFDGVTTTSQVARPALNSYTWNGTSYYRVTSEITLTLGSEGIMTTKVGRTTGRTKGFITQTCARVRPSESSHYLRCQFRVDAAVGKGDSGAAVFKVTHSPATHDVAALGILWGACLTCTTPYYWFSAFREIQQQLGAVNECFAGGGFSC